jgi:NADH-quinone oxidoreductase subunit N
MLDFIIQTSIADTVTGVISNLGDYISEMLLMSAIVLLVVIDLILKHSQKKQIIFGVLSIFFIGLILAFMIHGISYQSQISLFSGVKLILMLATIGSIVLMMQDQLARPGENYVMVLGVLMGSFFLINSETLLTFYISLEVMSISAYILTVLRFDKKSAEAGLKYLLFGATSSAIMLFGISLVYGFSGTIALDQININNMITAVGVYPVIVAFGMLSIGLLFKIAAAPQHIWSPDVYQTTNTSVVAYFSIVPKITGIIAFLVLLSNINIPMNWVSTVLSIVAIITMITGNFAALWQKNVKRMLAYSSIAHTGFLLIPVIVNSETAWQSFVFYAMIYMIMNLAAFALVMKLEKATNTFEIINYAGLGKVMPFTGVLFLIVMVSLVGLPPTAGFSAKLFLFSAIWESYADSGSTLMLVLLATGVLNTVVALFYYLKIPYFMFIKDAVSANITISNSSRWLNYFATIMVFLLLVLFFKPDWLMELIYNISFGI